MSDRVTLLGLRADTPEAATCSVSAVSENGRWLVQASHRVVYDGIDLEKATETRDLHYWVGVGTQ